MKIWLINHYAVPPQYYPLARPSLFAKNLIKMGHNVTIIAASTVHNSESENLIKSKEKVKKIIDDGIPYVLINCTPYQGNGLNRVRNILDFSKNLPKVLDMLEKPDVIVSTTFDPFTCYAGIKYARKYGITAIAEIADLWPEVLIVYNKMNLKNPLIRYLRNIEKNIYTQADRVVFTAAGEYEYIIEQGWEKELPKSKFGYINNGIDIELFDYNKEHFITPDPDLENDELFKVVYTGSIRKVNNVGGILEVAKNITDKRIKFLIWGGGDELNSLKKRSEDENIHNVVFKGKVEKKYIPYITSKADLNYAHNQPSPMFKYGISFNKIFDYLAAGKPILCDFKCNYNPVLMGNAGLSVDSANPHDIAVQIEKFVDMDRIEYEAFCEAARNTAKEYDFKILTEKLVNIIDDCR